MFLVSVAPCLLVVDSQGIVVQSKSTDVQTGDVILECDNNLFEGSLPSNETVSLTIRRPGATLRRFWQLGLISYKNRSLQGFHPFNKL